MFKIIAVALLLIPAFPAHGASVSNVARCTYGTGGSSLNLLHGTVTEYFTGYSFYDNTPPGTPDIAFPRGSGGIHAVAGGIGTFRDPITMAVGWCRPRSGREYPDYPPGTRFYIPAFKRYFVVEDECGDGRYPQNGPCHLSEFQPSQYHQFDLYVNGKGLPRSRSDAEMNALTGLHTIIENPPATLRVTPGSLTR